MEKTFWGTTSLVFLGLLIDTVNQTVSVPVDKIQNGRNLIQNMLNNPSKKVTLAQLQKVCGFLNFLGRCMILGCAFTRRLYAYTSSALMPHHHIRLNQEMKLDLMMWDKFLSYPQAFCRPFMDFSQDISAKSIYFYLDASGKIGMGAINVTSWMYQQWSNDFMEKFKPDIQCLEMYALVTAIIAWIHRYSNRRVTVYTDNRNVMNAVNDNSTSCKRCMVLVRLLVLHCLTVNVRVFAEYVKSKDNELTDALSRGQINLFKKKAIKAGITIEDEPTPIPKMMWPMEKLWDNVI